MEEGIEILIVEGIPDQALRLREILEKQGYMILTAADSNEALASAKSHKPKIVISNISMPEIDGYELCRMIKADDDLADTLVILLNGSSAPEDIVKVLECGADDLIMSPRNEQPLLSCIKRILADRKHPVTSNRDRMLDLLVRKSKELENALKLLGNYERNYHAFLEGNVDGIVIVDSMGKISYANSPAEALFGRKSGELLNENFSFPVVSGEKTEICITRSDGRAAITEMRAVEINWNGDRGYIVLLHDITERKQAEEALRKSEEKYRAVFELSPEAIVLLDKEGKVLDVNGRLKDWLGYEREGAIGKSISELPHLAEESKPRALEKLTRRMANQDVPPYEISFVTTSGERRVGRIVANSVRDENGKIIQDLAMISDVTERREAEEKMRLLSAAVETSHDGIIVTNIAGVIVYANKALEKITGIRLENILGKDIRALSTDLSGSEDIIQEVSEKGYFQGKSKSLDADNRELWTSSTSSLIKDEEGNPLGMVCIIRDITEQKRAEESLKDSLDRETQAYAQGRLEMVDTILHNIGNALNSVTIGIGTIQENLANSRLTHHILSLANAIREHQDDFSDYVKDDPQGQKVAPFVVALANDFAERDKELAKTVSRVWERAEHIADIIRTEKALSKRNVYRKEINLVKSIEDAITVLQDSIKKRNIEIAVDCDSAPKEINVQESQFHQMLINFVKNSIEAIDDLKELQYPNGNPFIKVKCHSENGSIILEVTDNGIGIEKDRLEAIFGAGYTTKKSGSGLGLHSAANFVNGCGGQIEALSDGIGKGVTMRVMLPLSSASQRNAASSERQVS